jgi:hypothetical protein
MPQGENQEDSNMANEYKYGEIEDWGEVDVKTGSDFMKLNEGDNVVRIVTKPYQFQVSWLKDPTGTSRKVRSACDPKCPLVRRGEKLQKRWYVGVIERRSNACRILEASSQIMAGIKNHADDPDWGDPRGYDINIKRAAPGSQPLYSVLAKPKKSLTDEDRTKVEAFLKATDFQKMVKPPTPEEVAERLVAIEGGQAAGQGQGQVRGNVGKKPTADPNLFNFDQEQL